MPEKLAKPKLEDVVCDVLINDAQRNALDFAAFLRANKLSPRWASANSWVISHKNQRVCYIRLSGTAHYHNLESGSWHISHVNYGHTNLINHDEDEQYISDELLGEIALQNVKYCAKCYNCKPGNAVTILDKLFDEVCHSWLLMKNPDANTLSCAKKIVAMRKRAIAKKEKT